MMLAEDDDHGLHESGGETRGKLHLERERAAAMDGGADNSTEALQLAKPTSASACAPQNIVA